MSDKNIGIEFNVTKKGDGAKEVKKAVEEVEKASDKTTASLKRQANELTRLAEASVAENGKTEANKELRKSAFEARAEYNKLKASANSFHSETTSGLDQMRTGYDEHISNLEEARDAQEKLVQAAQEEVRVQNDLREARHEADKRRRKSIKPGADINQIDDSAIGSSRDAKLKRLGANAKSAAGRFLKLGAAVTIVWKAFGFFGKKTEDAGDKMQSFAQDMRDSNTAGAGLVETLGKGAKSFGSWLNFYSNYKKAVSNLAEEKRKLVKIEANVEAALAKRARDIAKAIEHHDEAIEAHERYEKSLESRIQQEREFRLEIQKGNSEIVNRLKLLATETEGKLLDIDIQAERDLDKIDSDDPKASEKRFEIEKRREADKEAIRREDFAKKKQAEEERIAILEKERREAKNRAVELFNLTKEDTTHTEIISDSALEKLKAAANDKTDSGGRAIPKKEIAEIERQIEIQKIIRAKIKAQAGFESGDSIIAAIKQSKETADRKEFQKGNAQADLDVLDARESNRRKGQTANSEDQKRNFNNDQKQKQRARAEKAKRAQTQTTERANALGEKALGVAAGINNLPEVQGVKTKLDDFKDGASSQEVLALRDFIASMESFIDSNIKDKHILTAQLSRLAAKIKSQEQQLKNQRP